MPYGLEEQPGLKETFYCLAIEEQGTLRQLLDDEGRPIVSLDPEKAMEMRDRTDCPEAVRILYCEKFA